MKVKLLVVGAGGIGCELLKNLVLSGFKKIYLIDLDTIDFSNLNRQFLFRKNHVGMSKAEVAAKAASEYSSDVEIIPYHANIITDPRFHLEFYSQFSLVLNALDNLEARKHVNRMCLAVNVSLVESGTSGLLGQATVHLPYTSECFECVPHPIQQTFPVCTIRSTPSKPIHCVVWAKVYLFAKLFGQSEEDSEEITNEGSDGSELEILRKQESELVKIDKSQESYANRVFEKVFKHDIEKLLLNEEAWKDRTKPTPLILDNLDLTKRTTFENEVARAHSKWSIEESVSVFLETCNALAKRSLSDKVEFDKDDAEILDFCAAATSIRAHIFHIEQKSLFEVKEMAGNIIPAIASTNAIIAAFMTNMAKKITAGQGDLMKKLKTCYLSYSTLPKIFAGESLQESKQCQACGVVYRRLNLDMNEKTLADIISEILKSKKGFSIGEIEISILNENRLLYDPDFEDNASKTMKDLNLKEGASLTIIFESPDDSDTQKRWPLVVFLYHKEKCLELVGSKVIPTTNKDKESKKRSLEQANEEGSEKKKIRLDLTQDEITLD